MDVEELRHVRAGAVVPLWVLGLGLALALTLGCHKTSPPGGAEDPESGFSLDPARLAQMPFNELGFVPADAEAVFRVDLAALAASDDEHARMIAFLLRAQQPAAWEFLSAAEIEVGKDLRALYLVLGAGAKTPAFLLAGVGSVSADRVGTALRHAGGSAEPAPQGSAIYLWNKAASHRVGAAESQKGSVAMDAAIGVADGLLLLGAPDFVRRALAVRAGEAKGVLSSGPGQRHASALVKEIAAMDLRAVAWGAAHSEGDQAFLSSVAPGIRRARFRAARAPAAPALPDRPAQPAEKPAAMPAVIKDGGGPPIELRVVFATPAQADVFRGRLGTLMASVATLAENTPLGALLAKLKDGTTILVEGAVLTAHATL